MIIGGAVISAASYFTVWWAAVGLGLILNAYNTFGLLASSSFIWGISPPTSPGTYSSAWLVSKTRAFIS